MAKSEARVGKRVRGKKQEEWPQTPFYSILKHLCDEHEREVSALERKLEDLEKTVESQESDDSSEVKITAPDQPRTVAQPDPPKDEAAELLTGQDSSVASATAACLDSGEISAQTNGTDALTNMQTVTSNSTLLAQDASSSSSLTQDVPVVKKPPVSLPFRQELKKERPRSAGTWRSGATTVPGYVEEFNGVCLSDSAPRRSLSGTPMKRASRVRSRSPNRSKSPNGRQQGDSKLGALLLPPSSPLFKRGSAASSSNDGDSNGQVLTASNRMSAISCASGVPLRSDLPEAGFKRPSNLSGISGLQLQERTSNLPGISGLQLQERTPSKQATLAGIAGKPESSATDNVTQADQPRSLVLGEKSTEDQSPINGDQSPTYKKKRVGGSILRSKSQFDEDQGKSGKGAASRRISWAHGHTPEEADEEKDNKKSNRSNYKVMDIWKSQEDRATLLRISNCHKTRGVTRLSGAMMAIQKTFQTMGLTMEKKGTWEAEDSVQAPSEAQKVLIEFNERINRRGPERLVANPNSGWHFFWDLLSMVFIAYDLIIVPLTVFAVDDNSFTIAMGVFTATFWSFSIVRSFFTGFLAQGDVVMTLRDIARHYMRTWLFPDLLITLTEWVHILCFYSSAGDALMQVLDIFRMLQLLRGVKAVRIIKAIEERITRETHSVGFKLVKFFTCILMVNHLIACVWYGIGDSHRGNAKNWLEAYMREDADSLAYCYATSFHWALTQFTPASIEVQPRNALERFFAIIVLLFALVTVTSLISGITGAVMELRNLAATKSKQFWLLRRYLHESSVPTELALRVQHYLDFAWRLREHRLLEENVEVLGLLSTALRVQLNTAIFEPRISVHPLFVLIGKMASFIMQRLCNTAVMRIMLIQGDSLFNANTKMSKMFVINSGDLEYHLEDGRKPEQVKTGVWVCEPALWTEWSTYGSLVALTDSEIVSVDAACFGESVKMADEIWCEAVNYARGFVQGLNRIDKSRLTDLFYSNLIEGLWFRLLNDWNVRARPTLQNGIDWDGRSSIVSMAGTMMAPGAGLKQVEE